MANSTLTASIIAKEAVMILDNELVAAKKVFRGYEDEYDKNINGYKIGDTLTIRKPTDFTVRDGAVLSAQDVTEGSTTIVVNKRKGIDFGFSSSDLTLKIGELSERVIKPAMVQLANQIDSDVLALYSSVPSWVGTPGQTINSFSDFYKGPERLNEFGVPMDGRCALLSPADEAGMVGAQTALYIQNAANEAYRKGSLGMVGGVDTYMSQNIPTHTTGNFAGTVLIDLSITSATTTYASVKDTYTQTIHMDGFTTGAAVVKAGDVFTIADVWAVNSVTKARLPFLKQFVVVSDATMAANEGDLVISPPIIWSGAFKNVDITAVADLNNQAVTFLGTQSTGYRQNLIFNKNAFALVTVPLVSPPGAVDVSRQSYKGLNVRVIPVYDGTNDVSNWRLDVLYGTKAIDPRQALRISGTA
jgi:P22 coat protein - gene protein 5